MTDWQFSTSTPQLTVGEVHVWRIGLDIADGKWQALTPLLTEDEQNKADRFRFENHCRRHVVGRAALRTLLGEYLRRPPRSIEFAYNRHGKPRLADDGSGMRFNLSHTGEIMLAAFVLNSEIGIDIESVTRDVDCMALGQRCFSGLENQTLQSLPEDGRVDVFFRTWSRKEAYIKARGEGMSHPLQRFSISTDKHPPRLLEHLDDARETDRWIFLDLEVAEDCRAALVVESPPRQLHYFRLNIPPFDR